MTATAAPMPAQPLELRLATLFGEHVDSVFNVAYRVVWNRSDAEDVVQATFVKACTRLDQVRDPGRNRPWLLQVAYRESIAVVRRRRDVPVDPTELPDAAAEGRGPEELAIASEVAQLFSTALARLDDRERMAVVLRDVERLPMVDVAEILGVGSSAAKMRVHRGRQSLRRLLRGEGVR